MARSGYMMMALMRAMVKTRKSTSYADSGIAKMVKNKYDIFSDVLDAALPKHPLPRSNIPVTQPRRAVANVGAHSSIENITLLMDKLTVSMESDPEIKPQKATFRCPSEFQVAGVGSRSLIKEFIMRRAKLKTFTRRQTNPQAAGVGSKFLVEEYILHRVKVKISTKSKTKIKPRKAAIRRQKPTATIHDLPTEIVGLVFRYLENDRQTLRALRQVCKGFSELATPLFFRSVTYTGFLFRWSNFHILCKAVGLARYIRRLEIKEPCGRLLDPLTEPPTPSNLAELSIASLKIWDYQYLLNERLRLAAATSSLKELDLNTSEMRLTVVEGEVTYPNHKPLINYYSHNHFSSLRSLVITQGPPGFRDATFDVLILLSGLHFSRIEVLQLNFITTTPDHLVDFLESCNRETLRRLRIYRPVWSPQNSNYVRMHDTLSELKADTRINFEDSESWDRHAAYSEEEYSFMIENDILPAPWSNYIPENGWESDILNRYHERRRSKRHNFHDIFNHKNTYNLIIEDLQLSTHRQRTTMARSEHDAFAGVLAAALAKYDMAKFTKAFSQPDSRKPSADAGPSIEELIALMAKWEISAKKTKEKFGQTVTLPTKPAANIHDLPTELVLLIFECLEGDRQTLKEARQVCKGFTASVNPILFKSVSFPDSLKSWEQFYAFCQTPGVASHAKFLEMGGDLFCAPMYLARRNLDYLKIKSIKIQDYRCLLCMDVRVPIMVQHLTTLHIDTRDFYPLHASEPLNYNNHPMRTICGPEDLCSLQHLTVTQCPDSILDPEDVIDIVQALHNCRFGRLQNVKLHFITTLPKYLAKIFESCDRSILRYVRIYRPVWTEEELDDVLPWEIFFGVKDDTRVLFECTEPWDDRIEESSEEEILFMVENDIVPTCLKKYWSIDRGQSRLLDEYNDREGRKRNPPQAEDTPVYGFLDGHEQLFSLEDSADRTESRDPTQSSSSRHTTDPPNDQGLIKPLEDSSENVMDSTFALTVPTFSPTLWKFTSTSQDDVPTSSSFAPTPSKSTPTSQDHVPTSSKYTPASPKFAPTSPVYTPDSPAYAPTSTAYSPTSPQFVVPKFTPVSPPYNPTLPGYSPTIPAYGPGSLTAWNPNSPLYVPLRSDAQPNINAGRSSSSIAQPHATAKDSEVAELGDTAL
ncbi:MAG: hypothetical protein Q9218_005328 [Villophora microphyllina]